jgi:mRNA interferase RelE/StbE
VLRRLPPGIKRAVKSALREVAANPLAGEPLHGELEGLWKYRVRTFRLIYQVDRASRLVNILALGERRSIYEEVAELLRSRE